MSDWLKHPSGGQRDFFALFAALVTLFAGGYWINVFTSQLENSDGAINTLARLGWANLTAVAAIAAVVVQVLGPRYWRGGTESLYAQQIEPTLQRVFQLAIKAYIAARPGVLINGRYFSLVREKNREVLRKLDGVDIVTDEMPGQYGLMSVDLIEDDAFVVVEAIKTARPIYRELSGTHVSDYREEKRNQVDPKQSWVCACPILRIGSPPRGVVCLYGKTVPVHNEQDELALLTMAAELATTCGRVFEGYGLLRANVH